MRKINFFLRTIFLVIVLSPISLFSQTSTIMVTATTEREILSTTNFEPIKSISISDDRVLSLAHDIGSYFFLTEEGAPNTAINIFFS